MEFIRCLNRSTRNLCCPKKDHCRTDSMVSLQLKAIIPKYRLQPHSTSQLDTESIHTAVMWLVAVRDVFRGKWKRLYASGFEGFKYSKGDGTQSGRKWYSRRKGCLAHLFTDYVSDTLLNGECKPEPHRNKSR